MNLRTKFVILALANLAICQPASQNNGFEKPRDIADPTAVDGHNRGSFMCRTIDHNECNRAIGYFVDEQRYTEHTDIAVAYDHNHWYFTGCKAEFYCDDEADYAQGISGKGIKEA